MSGYRCSARPRGLCVIINNRNFPGCVRDGTDIDRDNLKNVFKEIDFKVNVYENLTDTDITRRMDSLAQQHHYQLDCFVCCILSHGGQGTVSGVNGRPVKMADLTAKFRASKCPSLAGKPKLFFAQTCQGHGQQSGLEVSSAAGYLSWRTSDETPYIYNLVRELQNYYNTNDISDIMTEVSNRLHKQRRKLGGLPPALPDRASLVQFFASSEYSSE